MGYNPYHINENIKAGITYYKLMYKMFGSMELALAAYNAGPGNVKKYNGIPPFIETQKFVKSIKNSYHHFKANPDPAISGYKNSLKNIADFNCEDDCDFRRQQEEPVYLYLSNIGI